MARAAVDQLLYLLDEAFDGPGGRYSLMGNLRSVTDEDWLWAPRRGAASIRELVGSTGAAKYLNDDQLFGSGTLSLRDPAGDLGCTIGDLSSLPPLDNEPPRERVIDWLAEGHRRWRDHVAALDDEDLLKSFQFRSSVVSTYVTREFITTILEIDVYRAGEINHIRALRQGKDG